MKTQLFRPLLAAMLVGVLAGSPVAPVYAQEPAQTPPPSQQPTPGQTPTPPAVAKPAAQGGVPISLGVSKFDYSKPPSWFPNLSNAYRMHFIEPAPLTNSPRLEQLIHDGKLQLSLQDAIALAMENSMDIVVQRYNPWTAEASVLKTKAGGFGYGTPGSIAVGSTANLPDLLYDPYITQYVAVTDSRQPINNPFTSGAGAGAQLTNQAAPLTSHYASYNTTFSKNFDLGTSFQASWDNTRASSTAANFFNPYVSSSLNVSVSQQLLAGAGRFVNRRNIIIAENNQKVSDLAFTQQAITTTTNTINAYWELVYARENVAVQQKAVTVAEKLYNDNKKQLEIGTMAPLDVTRAESELATDRQDLIVAETTRLQDELVLKNYISKDPTASNLINVEIIPTDRPEPSSGVEAPTFEDAVKEAFQKRPDIREQYYNLKNADVDVRATKNALLPTATLGFTYTSAGLAGNSSINGTPSTIAGSQIVDANGLPILVSTPGGVVGVPIYEPATVTPVVGVSRQGFSNAQSQIFHNKFPTYAGQLTFQLPLRNRANQADNIHAQLVKHQYEAQIQQIKNNALIDVRNTTIALQQGRAQVEAATKARELQQQTFDAEQKKYQLGASTVYNVILTQRDLISAQGAEIRALANLAEAKANYERALGRTLEVNNVTIANHNGTAIEKDTLIPGTLNGQVVGTQELFRALEQANLPSGQR